MHTRTNGLSIALLAAASSVHAVRWANAFVERGHRVHLITQHACAPGLDGRVTLVRMPHHHGLGYLLNRVRLAHLLQRVRPDVVNVHYASGYGTLGRGIHHVPVVLNVWGSDVHEFPDRTPLHRWWLLRNLRSADRIVSTSTSMARRVQGLLKYERPITVVPFGVDPERFKPDPRPAEGPVVIGTVKTLSPTYGVDRLIRAFAHLVRMKGVPDLRLRIVGDGPQRKELERLVTTLGVQDRTVLAGAAPHAEVPGELGRMHVFVALSRAESFGVAVIEASACALPVVVSDAGGLPEVVEEGVTGYVVPQGDPMKAAERLFRLVTDPEERVRLGEAGRRWVQERFAWDRCVDRMLGVLEEMALRG
ncbi:MAG: glycosyltransferase [Flavobacteriales bacterium]|nr:glycosyltransferase [Flavobacteriales bacterium]